MFDWIIKIFPDTKSKIIAGLALLVLSLGWMQLKTIIDNDISSEIMVVEDELSTLEQDKSAKIDMLEKKIIELEHKIDNVKNYAAKGVWSAIQENKTDIEVLKNTKRDKK